MEPVTVLEVVRDSADETPDGLFPVGQNVAPEPLLVHDLYHDFDGLAPLLLGELQRGHWLNAFLLAAGIDQIVADYLHPDPYRLNKAAGYLSDLRPPVGALAASATRALAGAIVRVRRLRPSQERLAEWQADFATLVRRLAEVVAEPTPAPGVGDALLASGQALLAAAVSGLPPGLRREVLHLPSCFRSFDQQPADLERMVADFARRWPDRGRSLVVVGIRTSGSYLAPLYAAYLKRQGYTDVGILTLRPRRRLLTPEQEILRAVIRAKGLVLLADDPPASGASVAKAAADLRGLGAPVESIVLFLQLFGGRESLPRALQPYASVLLPWEEWAIHAQLLPAAVRSALAALVDSGVIPAAVERLPLPGSRSERSHVRALYQVAWSEPGTGRHHEEQIFVKGAGLGYFGEYSLAVVNGLREFLPRVYGYRAGLLYRTWLREERALDAVGPNVEESLAVASAGYVAARERALATREDMSLRLSGEGPAWEAASNILSRVFGRFWPVLRVPVVDPVARRLLRVTRPSVVDGNMVPSRWFVGEPEEHLLKVDFDEGPFRCDVELTCYDSVYDLASLAASFDLGVGAEGHTEQLSSLLRREYERLTDGSVADERWLLYQLVHLRDLQRTRGGEQPAVRRALSRAVQRYFAAHDLSDLAVSTTGALVALDIDGVLEASVLGFPTLTPASALTLRALVRHGYRTVLATGRGLDEVRERCRAYHLTGGVAEYGAALYNTGADQARSLLSEDQREDLRQLHAALLATEGVYLDADYQYSVRAYNLNEAGHRRGLSADVIAAALARAGVSDRVRPVAGESQTDFVVNGIDKGTGLRALATELGAGAGADGKLLALAVGDTLSDLPMFSLAARPYAPAHADAEVRAAGIERMRRPYQAGLALAAARLLGHKPGGCPVCRASRPSAESRLLLTLLGAPEAGQWGMLRAAVELAIRARLP
jgi:hydroxymethylpyrimidine pyrophosphatase-like HAD family hydrolase